MWTHVNTLLKFLLLFSLAFVSISEAAPPTVLSPELAAHQYTGFSYLYNLQHAAAKKEFQLMIQKDSKHPSGYVYLASALWLEEMTRLRRIQTQLYNRGNAFFRQREPASVDARIEKSFYQTIEKGILRAEMRLRANPKDAIGLYYLGSAHGAIAGYESTIKRSFFSSLQHGRRAVDAHKKLVKLYPDFTDAYLSIGMYNYVVGRLPAGIKILMLLGGVRGSKEAGLKQLEIAADQSRFAKDEASAVLVLLYDRERKQELALKQLQKLTAKYPENPIFRFETAVMLEKLGRFSESAALYDALLKEESARGLLLDYIQFQYAELLFFQGAWEKAWKRYVASRRVREDSPVGLISMSHLRSGQCLNALGRNEEAAREYQFVLKQPEIYDSHKLARKYLRAPFGKVTAAVTR